MDKKLKQKLKDIGWTVAVSAIFGAFLAAMFYMICGLLTLLLTSVMGV